VDSGKIGADESNLLGNGESSTVSLSSTDSLALIVKLAALPAAKVEELTLPPFRSTSLAVLIVTAPASPALNVSDMPFHPTQQQVTVYLTSS
jgi:hypothetical protein